MAEATVLCLIETLGSLLVDKGIPLLANEVKLLRGVHKEIASFKSELESIQAFLKDADSRAESGESNESVKIWVKQVRKAAYQIEDVIEEYILHLAQRSQPHGCINFFPKVACWTIEIKPRHEIASRIQDIKANLREIMERAERYRFSSSEQGSSSGTKDSTWHDPRVASLFIGEDEVVGIEFARDELISKLGAGESNRTVISIVGMPGVGKTTLAKKVYDHHKLTPDIDCHAWIPVSQTYNIMALLRTMIKSFYESREAKEPDARKVKEPDARKAKEPDGIDATDKDSLLTKLREYLQQRRYVVVFDDVWNTDFWGYIRNGLPDNGKGNRVIITTRNDEVASSCKESSFDHEHKLQPLPPDKAWELFCKKAFQFDCGGHCPPELKKSSLKIIQKCEGLPLAIAAIGGLLSTKNKDVHKWENMAKSVGYELERNPRLASISKIVFLSYYDLPYYLKSCFLYFAIIPEDYSIRRGRLIRLWIAEGFVKGQKGKTLEEVAEDYLSDLICRSLVQVSGVDFLGKAYTCRVHDVVREIILSKSKELSFCNVLDEDDSSILEQTRRLSIHKIIDDKHNIVESMGNSQIRSLFLFGVKQQVPECLLGKLVAQFKLLKVLDLEDAPLPEYLPEEVAKLFHLRYLSVRRTKVKKLPKSIGKLLNLQTLDLKYSLVAELPTEINGLRKLRHISTSKTVRISKGIGHLKQLQKLYFVSTIQHDDDEANIIKELINLEELRTLGIEITITTKNWRVLSDSIVKMKHLKSLVVDSISEDENEMVDLQTISSQSLQRLGLGVRLKTMPDWILKLQNLVKLNLRWPRLTDDPLKGLNVLPNLLLLNLWEDDGEHQQLYFEAGGFQKLEHLQLYNLKGLNSIVMEEGVLPRLEFLVIAGCPQLKEVPSGIQHLTKLKQFGFSAMPVEFKNIISCIRGQNYRIINFTES